MLDCTPTWLGPDELDAAGVEQFLDVEGHRAYWDAHLVSDFLWAPGAFVKQRERVDSHWVPHRMGDPLVEAPVFDPRFVTAQRRLLSLLKRFAR